MKIHTSIYQCFIVASLCLLYCRVFLCQYVVVSNRYLSLRLWWYGGVFDVQRVQLLDAPAADGHRGVSQSHRGSPPGAARAAAGGVVLRPLLAGQGGAATGPVAHGLRYAELAVVDLVCELVVL